MMSKKRSDYIGELYLLYRRKIQVPEPSGLVLSSDAKSLWTVSDQSGDFYQMDLQGEVVKRVSFDGDDLEGITILDSLFYLLEEGGQVRVVDEWGRCVTDYTISLSSSTDPRLEGITYNPDNQHFYILNEKKEKLLIELDRQFKVIRETKLKGAKDFSGMVYDPGKQGIWMLSHESHALMLWDLAAEKFVVHFDLAMVQPEGIAIDLLTKRFYMVGDQDQALWVYGYRLEPKRIEPPGNYTKKKDGKPRP